MEDIRHVSFDLWGTLIYSDPKHSRVRALAIEQFLQRLDIDYDEGLSVESIHMRLLATKRQVDTIMDHTGMQYSHYACLMSSLLAFGVHPSRITIDVLSKYEAVLSEVFTLHPPLLLEGVRETLSAIHDMGISMSILSNTSFIPGSALLERLISLGVSRYFSFMLFSDEHGIAKPNKAFYSMLLSRVNLNVHSFQILHVGDNAITDGAATHYDINTLIINNEANDNTIYSVVDALKQEASATSLA
jgi:putative hydrolase of the HAD superfamily